MKALRLLMFELITDGRWESGNSDQGRRRAKDLQSRTAGVGVLKTHGDAADPHLEIGPLGKLIIGPTAPAWPHENPWRSTFMRKDSPRFDRKLKDTEDMDSIVDEWGSELSSRWQTIFRLLSNRTAPAHPLNLGLDDRLGLRDEQQREHLNFRGRRYSIEWGFHRAKCRFDSEGSGGSRKAVQTIDGVAITNKETGLVTFSSLFRTIGGCNLEQLEFLGQSKVKDKSKTGIKLKQVKIGAPVNFRVLFPSVCFFGPKTPFKSLKAMRVGNR
ncbi:hypothetical protein B0H17DRAFT_1131969 [Mycena rosella]|uniref:Uncharacterized protein n=1 Tax=Mycena rosella TaxID=1033263 RepID=A0AAD7DPA4_MYCRO|nr:hypothetical protein B0H17DRAFT_1131969 [Mycena rosella]